MKRVLWKHFTNLLLIFFFKFKQKFMFLLTEYIFSNFLYTLLQSFPNFSSKLLWKRRKKQIFRIGLLTNHTKQKVPTQHCTLNFIIIFCVNCDKTKCCTPTALKKIIQNKFLLTKYIYFITCILAIIFITYLQRAPVTFFMFLNLHKVLINWKQ